MSSTKLYGGNVRANGIRQHYVRYGGTGVPLLLVPGITSPAATWGFVAERFGRHFQTYVLDPRGRGLSEAGPHLDYSLDSYAADIHGFAAALGLARYHLVGHSMGARIGIRLARRHGGDLDRLVLVDPPVTGPGRPPYPTPIERYVDAIRLARAGADHEAMRRFMPSWTDDQLRTRAEWLHTCDETAVVESYRRFHEEDIHCDLPHIAVSTLLLTAGKGVIGESDIEEICGLMPAITVRTVADAGHMIPWDDYEGFFAAIGDFLDPDFARG